MIKRELLSQAPGSVRYIILNVVCQLARLFSSIALVFTVAFFIRRMSLGQAVTGRETSLGALIIVLCALIRWLMSYYTSLFSHLASADAKRALRKRVYEKMVRLGPSYTEKVSTGEVVQISVEGIDQLETYFGRYVPQFFYALFSPVVLFAVLSFVSLRSAIVLFICVPLIPLSIVLVQKLARNLLRRYWGRYTRLGDTFLENMEGLTTLKIYGADGQKHREMNEKAEEFRDITMKVLTMQLNSIIIMDIVAYGGAALGIIMAVTEAASGRILLWQAFTVIMLSADFFLPMRTLGSYFHVAMNGMAAADKMFAILRLDEAEEGDEELSGEVGAEARDLTFSYDGETDALKKISLSVPPLSLTAVVGESGCGKSTLAALLTGGVQGYFGSLTLSGHEVYNLRSSSLRENITMVTASDYIFSGTVRDNLEMGCPDAGDEKMIAACRDARIWDWLEGMQGLDTVIENNAANLSGGQRQRIALARALLHDTPMYIFDEATISIDAESEEAIMEAVYAFRGRKTVLLITHRLENAVRADRILVMDRGEIAGCGTHEELLRDCQRYRELFRSQAALEKYARGDGTK